jgi:hypothetical protein
MSVPARRLFKHSTHTELLFREASGLASSRTPLQENYDAESIRRHCRRMLACESKSSGSFFEERPDFVSGWLYYAPRGTFADWAPASVFWVGDDGHVALAAVDGGDRGVEVAEGAAGLRPEELGQRLASLRGRAWSEAELERVGLGPA